MGRIQVTYPYAFTQESGNQPAEQLDANFNQIPNAATLTIRTQELSNGSDYNVVEDDEYSFFVCKGVVDFQVIPPVAPAAGFSFFVSNETEQEAVQIDVTICCTIFVGTVMYVNPILVGDFPPLYHNVKGGLVQFDGNNYFFYPLWQASSGAGAVLQATVTVNSGDTSVTITHGFNQAGLSVVLLPQWNTSIWQTAQSATQVTFEFSNPVPLSSPTTLELTYLVFFP